MSNSFRYDSTLNPVITDLSPKNVSVVGGTTITISGSGFLNGAELPKITVDDTDCIYVSHTSTQIQCITPSLGVGERKVSVSMTGRGSAYSMIYYYLHVYDINPKCGSLVGGSSLTITGEGFGDNKTRAAVFVGDHPCHVNTLSDNEITCTTTSASKTVHLDNSAAHSGLFLAFSLTHLLIFLPLNKLRNKSFSYRIWTRVCMEFFDSKSCCW